MNAREMSLSNNAFDLDTRLDPRGENEFTSTITDRWNASTAHQMQLASIALRLQRSRHGFQQR